MLSFLGIGHSQSISDSIQQLDEVVLSDFKLKRYANGYKVTVLSDSVLRKNQASLTDVLRFNSNIYFKENGFGMVSSPSFRGTNASQTAVVWNGININSQLNGQADFNTISTSNYDNVSIRSGGGSVQYGSGAIGGTVHLSNELDFSPHLNHQLQLAYGSFETKRLAYRTAFGSEKWSGSVGVGYLNSDNDYRFLGTDRRNENAAFDNLDISLNLGYTLSKKDVVKAFHQNFRSDRELSETLLAPSKSKLENEDYRTMLEWSHISNRFTSSIKAVHLKESFRYFENKDLIHFSKGQATTWLLKHHFKTDILKRLTLSVITDYSYVTAEGDSFSNPKRNAFSATAIVSHRPIRHLQYNINVRKDVISDFESPLVFSADMSYSIFKPYTLKLNASKNFRVPTFNDLYWNPGGNLDLKPEESFQVDLGHELRFKNILAKFNSFYIETTDLIEWQPNNMNGYWSPVNVANARHYGLESEMQVSRSIVSHQFLLLANYTFTKAEDVDQDQPLFYVPEHKVTASLSYSYKAFTMFYQHLYNGEVTIIGDTLDGFDVGNIGLSYTFNNKNKVQYIANLRINNVYNSYYENVALRPMPNRNFNFNMTLKF